MNGWQKLKKDTGGSGRVHVGFVAASEAEKYDRHASGRGVPVRDPVGITADIDKYTDAMFDAMADGKITLNEALKRIGMEIVKVTELRARRGRNADGSPMQEYSARYLERRKAYARPLRPDLTWTGIMWQSYNYEVQVS